jgi:PAS domain S-box-containing protein
LTARRGAGTLDVMTALETLGHDVEEALEHINVPSYVIDDHGIIRWVNPAAMQVVGDVRGKQFTSVVAPEEKSRAQHEYAKKVFGTTKTTDAEVVVLDGAGQRLKVEVHSVRLLRGDRVVGVFGQVDYEPVHEPVNALPSLTPRQSEILRLLERGKSTDQIAMELHLSKETVRNHIRHMLQALGVHSRLEAVALARHEHMAGIRQSGSALQV